MQTLLRWLVVYNLLPVSSNVIDSLWHDESKIWNVKEAINRLPRIFVGDMIDPPGKGVQTLLVFRINPPSPHGLGVDMVQCVNSC